MTKTNKQIEEIQERINQLKHNEKTIYTERSKLEDKIRDLRLEKYKDKVGMCYKSIEDNIYYRLIGFEHGSAKYISFRSLYDNHLYVIVCTKLFSIETLDTLPEITEEDFLFAYYTLINKIEKLGNISSLELPISSKILRIMELKKRKSKSNEIKEPDDDYYTACERLGYHKWGFVLSIKERIEFCDCCEINHRCKERVK